jgi:hypothetical protein
MLSPCNNKNRPILNTSFSPTLWARATSCANAPTPLMQENRKQICLNYDYHTNGVGIPSLSSTRQLPTTIHDIRMNNIIYKIPCLYYPHIEEIKALLLQKRDFKSILAYLDQAYGIKNIQNTPLLPLTRQYRYLTADTNQIQYQNVGIFRRPYMLTNKITFTPDHSGDIASNLIAIINDSKHLEVSTNDGKQHTSNINEILPGGSASYWGSKLTTTPDAFILSVVVTSIESKLSVPGIIVYTGSTIVPTQNLYFVPTLSSLMMLTYKPLPENTAITVKIQDVVDVQLDNTCKYTPYRIPFANPTYDGGATGSGGNTGPTGPTGERGDTGSDGTNGNDGATGYTGANGTNGNDGATGYTGSAGTNGNDGLTGATGEKGADGATGYTGANGTNGNDGLTGATGEKGVDGATGYTGANGTNGNDGLTGATGEKGADGADGQGISDDNILPIFAKFGISLPDFGKEPWVNIKTTDEPFISISVSASGQYQTAVSEAYIYTSNNFGVNWNKYTDVPASFTSISVSASGQYQTAVSSTFIYKSKNFGINWTQLDAISAPGRNWSSISISSSGKFQTTCNNLPDGNTQNMAGFNISNNYGSTFLPIHFPIIPSTGNQSTSIYAVSISASGQHQTTVAYEGSMYISKDFGLTWSYINIKESATWTSVSISMSASGQYQTVVASDGSMYTSDKFGLGAWTVSDSTNNWKSVSVSASGQYQVAVSDSEIVASYDFGNIWNPWILECDTGCTYQSIAISSSGQYQTVLINNISANLFYIYTSKTQDQITTNGATYTVGGELQSIPNSFKTGYSVVFTGDTPGNLTLNLPTIVNGYKILLANVSNVPSGNIITTSSFNHNSLSYTELNVPSGAFIEIVGFSTTWFVIFERDCIFI